MKRLFEHSSFYWVRYDRYELRRDAHSLLYITPAANAKPEIYNPLKVAEQITLDALKVGMKCMNRQPTARKREAVTGFVNKYGLLGLMTALPTTPHFMNYEAVYLFRNHFIEQETMSTEDYLSNFFPFGKLDVEKKGTEYEWNIEGERDMRALALTFAEQPTAMNMSFQRQYAERFDWLVTQFRDLTFNLLGAFLYAEDYKKLDEDGRRLYQRGIAAFGSVAPTYHISLLDRPVLVWDFYSLLSELQMISSVMLTDEEGPVRLCKECMEPFIADSPDAFLCPDCENQHKNPHGK